MLEQSEIKELKRFATLYSVLHIKMTNMEKLLEKLGKEKNDLVNELEYVRQEELSFTGKLVEKYGSDIMNTKEVKDAITSAIGHG